MDSQRSKLHNLPARKEGSKNSNHPPANSKEKDGPAQRLSKNCGYIASCINGNGIPGGCGHFTAIWAAMKGCNKGWIKLTLTLKEIFSDFGWLFREIVNKPINVAQLIPKLPNCHGYSDACKYGAGGVWIIPGNDGKPRYIFWSIDFPLEVVCLFELGILSINDL